MGSARGPRHAGWALLGLVLLLLLGAATLATPARADDEEPPAASATDAESPQGASMDELEERLLENPVTWVLRFGPIAVGVLLLILLYLKWDKIRGGMLPAPPPVRPTGPFGLGLSSLLAIGGLVAVPALVVIVYMVDAGPLRQGSDVPFWVAAVATALGFVAVAAVVIWRRHQLLHRPDRVATYGFFAPPLDAAGTRPPGLLAAFGFGGWAMCVASLLVVPVALVWAYLLEQMGIHPETQQLVQEVVTSKDDSIPWLIAGLGVIAAPVGEECVFRAMLYPAVRSLLRGTRHGTWKAAILVSLLFALIHFNWLALLPLFALAMVLTWVFEKTNSLAAVIVAHALHNLFALVPLLLDRFSG